MLRKVSSKKEEFLVGIINTQPDYEIIQNQLWYRIPVDKLKNQLERRWPPKWLAFYYTNAIKNFPQMIIHYAKVSAIKEATRQELFPREKESYKSNRNYYKI
jgi:hypothetical protein